MFQFEKFEVWQVAIQFTNHVYRVTKAFPSDERFGLTSQLRRAAVSIAANIAEGAGRSTDKDFIRFLEIAYVSLMESFSHLKIAELQTFITNNTAQPLYELGDRLARMLSGLRNSREK